MADISTDRRFAKVPVLGDDGRLPDKYVPQVIDDAVKQAEASATAAKASEDAATSAATAAASSATTAQAQAQTAEGAATSASGSADRAQQALDDTDALYQQTQATATAAAASATEAAASAEEAADKASAVEDNYIDSATATTLPAGSEATASVADRVLTIGVPQGAKGDTGPQGPQGEKGDTGPQGPQGADGEDGAPATVAVGTTETGEAGTGASVTNSGTASAAVLDFVIPKGDKGDPGEPYAVPAWDEGAGEYARDSLVSWLAGKRDGNAYSVIVPDGLTVSCVKADANAGIADPVPGTAAAPGTDPYFGVGPFFYVEVNGYADADGTPHVTAVSGDANFSRDGSNGDVWVLAPALYWRFATEDGGKRLTVSDTRLAGLEPQPGATLPDGTLRPYMLYAKYPLSVDADGNPRSMSGVPIKNFVSHDSLITLCETATTGYSARSIADDWYVKVMLLLKYATKNSQSVMAGCTSYPWQYGAAATERATNRVVLTAAQAANVLVGSSVSLGSTDVVGADRGASNSHDVVDMAEVTAKETLDDGTVAVVLGDAGTFDVTEGMQLSSMPWRCGACDGVQGDGSPTSNTSMNEPFVLQGIELAHGMYEVMHGVALDQDADACRVVTLADTRDETTSLANYADTGVALSRSEMSGWVYPTDLTDAGGMLVGTGSGGSGSTGTCDGECLDVRGTVGTREWLSVGNLGQGSLAGLWCAYCGGGPGYAGWHCGSRLSVTGRSRG